MTWSRNKGRALVKEVGVTQTISHAVLLLAAAAAVGVCGAFIRDVGDAGSLRMRYVHPP